MILERALRSAHAAINTAQTAVVKLWKTKGGENVQYASMLELFAADGLPGILCERNKNGRTARAGGH